MAAAATEAQSAQAEVDYQMSPSKWSARMGPDAVITAHCTCLDSESATARGELHCELNVPIALSKQTVDITFPSQTSDARKVFFYIHGGMWQFFSKRESLFMARPLAAHGVTVVAPDYTIAPSGTMAQMVEELRLALAYVLQRFATHDVYISGHSAGGHLAVMMMLTDWSRYACASAASRIKGVIPVSGLFNLQPVKDCYANEALRLTDADVAAFSPNILLKEGSGGSNIEACKHTKVVVIYAQRDPTEFRAQSIALVQLLKSHGIDCDEHDISDMDHFDVIECLRDKSSRVSRIVQACMGLPLA